MTEAKQQQLIEAAAIRAVELHSQAIHANCPFNNEDQVFVHTWRKRIENTVNAVGVAVILAILGTIGGLITLGVNAWKD